MLNLDYLHQNKRKKKSGYEQKKSFTPLPSNCSSPEPRTKQKLQKKKKILNVPSKNIKIHKLRKTQTVG